MKRILSLVLVISLMFCLPGCKSNRSILEFLNSHDQIILYSIFKDKITKDTEVSSVYVIQNGYCTTYGCRITLGELTGMTDTEVIDMLERNYETGLMQAVNTWISDPTTNDLIRNDLVKLYEKNPIEIVGCLCTDSTGAKTEGELICFPQTGFAGNPYIIQYDNRYYSNYKRDYGPNSINFSSEFIELGRGEGWALSETTNFYYLTADSMFSGQVYDCTFYGLRNNPSQWDARADYSICFRIDNTNVSSLHLDTTTSSLPRYIDPSKKDILNIAYRFYSEYCNCFKTF